MRRILFLVLGFLLIPVLALAAGSRWFHLDYSGNRDVNRGGTAMAYWDFDSAVGGTLLMAPGPTP